jgi:ferredoxin-NADP reductase
MQFNPFTILLEEAFMISPQVKHFIFRASQNPPFNYIPGQFITIHFEVNGKILRRSYSIANDPLQDNKIEFSAGYVEGGPGTNLLFNLKPGDSIQITGPFGRLILKESNPKRYMLVATSTGVTPYRAMLPELRRRLDRYPDLKIVILQGVQKKEDVLFENDFLAFAEDSPRVEFRVHLSRESENLDEHQRSGYVQTSFPELKLSPEEDLIYLCGNPGMIDDSFAYLKDNGFAMQQIIREKYISR